MGQPLSFLVRLPTLTRKTRHNVSAFFRHQVAALHNRSNKAKTQIDSHPAQETPQIRTSGHETTNGTLKQGAEEDETTK
ncbi:hypothetical protein J1614_003899 [Plenodomus biglobosus]|nr:hypothetical protein J1614_003899 [Plenodomus biglobosus]